MCFLAIYDGSFSFYRTRPAQVLFFYRDSSCSSPGRVKGWKWSQQEQAATAVAREQWDIPVWKSFACLPQLLKHQHPLLLKSQQNLSSCRCFRNNDPFSYCLFISHQKNMLPHFSTILTSRTEVKTLSVFFLSSLLPFPPFLGQQLLWQSSTQLL